MVLQTSKLDAEVVSPKVVICYFELGLLQITNCIRGVLIQNMDACNSYSEDSKSSFSTITGG